MKNLLCIVNGVQKTVITDSLFLEAVLSVKSKNPIYRLTRNGVARVSVKHSSNYNARKYRKYTVGGANWFLVFDKIKDIYLLINYSGLIGKNHRIIAMTNHNIMHYHSDIAHNYYLILHRDTLRYMILRNGRVAYSVARKSLAKIIEEIEELASFDNALHFYAQLNKDDKRKFINTLISVDYTINDI